MEKQDTKIVESNMPEFKGHTLGINFKEKTYDQTLQELQAYTAMLGENDLLAYIET